MVQTRRYGVEKFISVLYKGLQRIKELAGGKRRSRNGRSKEALWTEPYHGVVKIHGHF